MLTPNLAAKTATRLFLASLVALILTFLLGSLAFGAAIYTQNIPLDHLNSIDLDYAQRQVLRLGLLVNNFLLFVGAAVLALWYVYRNRWAEAVRLDRGPRPGSTSFALGLFIFSLPVVAYSAYLNLQVPLPEWAATTETQTDNLLVQLLTMNGIDELVVSLLTIGVTAGLGEELLLRGVFQKRILIGWLGNHHVAIWLAATVFSTMHFEFAGFVPRLLLGVTLGYGYHWTNSLWVPILLHLAFNSVQVIMAYVTGEFNPQTMADEVPAWWMAVISLLASVALAYFAERRFGGLADAFDLPVATDALLDR